MRVIQMNGQTVLEVIQGQPKWRDSIDHIILPGRE